ncbi:hypothetical protein CEXT_604931 [Caerostris extrusa]|uniref:LAGLIDADG homing endonuclease n=1 Tax=Caerostris extrusa TaxID=172846 RepID=A0AAV4RZF1_CAEEX|nr:hypothetical protein CEXT_604931 [Caerostris extrusa]
MNSGQRGDGKDMETFCGTYSSLNTSPDGDAFISEFKLLTVDLVRYYCIYKDKDGFLTKKIIAKEKERKRTSLKFIPDILLDAG